jgi:hypothetical protein
MVPLERIKDKRFKLSKIGKDIKIEDLQIAFVLLKRAQRILNIKCQHPHSPEIDFILEQIGDKPYFDKNNKKVNLKEKWLENHWCEQIDFSRDEICKLFEAVDEFYANKMTDDIMFRGSVDQDDNFTQQEYIFAYYSELLRDKIKRRTLSSFYVKI